MPEASDEVSSDESLSASVPELINVGITRDKQMTLSRLYATAYKRFVGITVVCKRIPTAQNRYYLRLTDDNSGETDKKDKPPQI